jgi:hypothetical protein
MAEGMGGGVAVLVMEGETTSDKPFAESVIAEGMEGAAVVGGGYGGETTSGKPLAECAMAEGMEGTQCWLWRGKPHQVNHWQNF